MNKLTQLFAKKQSDILNIYFTAGYPALNDTGRILKALDESKVDIIEIGMPYSDPMADGPTIQASGSAALKNGMTLDILFDQVRSVRPQLNSALILMGYYNQVLQYGPADFFAKCKEVGIDGLILPDLPLHEYESVYRSTFEKLDLGISFLMTPQTPNARILKIDELTRGFIYMVSSSSVTGAANGISSTQLEYFDRTNKLKLNNPRLIGFGISDNQSFETACKFANGAIIGSAFIKALSSGDTLKKSITEFVQGIKAPQSVS